MLAVEANDLAFVKDEGLVDVRREDWIVENIVIEGGARAVINLREGQMIWWGSGMLRGELENCTEGPLSLSGTVMRGDQVL